MASLKGAVVVKDVVEDAVLDSLKAGGLRDPSTE